MAKIITTEYKNLLGQIKERIRSAQYDALRAVNKELISLYWDIGKMIVGRQKGQSWGKSIVEKLAQDLQQEFPGIQGFSNRNLWRMKLFYETYQTLQKLAPVAREIGRKLQPAVGETKKLQPVAAEISQKLPPLVAEISWSHNVAIMEGCKNDLEREFYIRMTSRMGWSKNVLIHQIANKTYEKTLLNQTNFEKTLPEKVRNQAKLAVRDEYTFDFLELGDEHSEKELERALLSRIEHFLREMGGMFAFIGSQYRLEVDGTEYFIDLLLYHRLLRSLVAIELKIGKFIPEYVGKMQFYLSVLNDKVRIKNENPSIGIVLCKSKNKTMVEYALRDSRRPIGVAEYRMVSHLPKSLRGKLPAPEKIAELLEGGA